MCLASAFLLGIELCLSASARTDGVAVGGLVRVAGALQGNGSHFHKYCHVSPPGPAIMSPLLPPKAFWGEGASWREGRGGGYGTAPLRPRGGVCVQMENVSVFFSANLMGATMILYYILVCIPPLPGIEASFRMFMSHL